VTLPVRRRARDDRRHRANEGTPMSDTARPPRPLPPGLKMLVELGPAAAFFVAYLVAGLFVATAAIMVASVLSIGLAWTIYRRVPTMPLVSAVMVVVFGSITLVLNDKTFIMMKPTVLNAMFAAVLVGGVVFFDKPLLKILFGEVFSLNEVGWRKLSLRWGLMFAGLAVVNEAVWRTLSETDWALYKTFGQTILIFLFTMTQLPMIMAHEQKSATPDAE
jgi:intracellular septation protein